MLLTTKLTKKLAIKFPIIQAPMAGGATTPELVAAVSNSGALGSLGAGYMAPKEIRDAIGKIRQLSNKPFSVNLFIPNQHSATPEQIKTASINIHQSCYELSLGVESIPLSYSMDFNERLNVILEEQIPIFSFTFGLLAPQWISKFQENNITLIGTATTLAEALMLEKSGVDAVVAQGCEAGGHRGTFLGPPEDALIGLMSLLPQLVDKLKIPVIAAGGIMDGSGIAALISLGASCVQMGTAFLSCKESGVSELYKKTLLAQQQDNTTLTRAFSGKLARGIRNLFMDRMSTKEKTILDYPIQNALTRTMRKTAEEQGNMNFMSLWAGQSAQLCRDLGAEELVTILVNEMIESR